MRRIGLADIDSRIPNLALMKLSAWHKNQGDSVEFYSPINHAIAPYDVVYASKVFSQTPDDPYLPDVTIRGGTGYGLIDRLPDDVEHITPDYALYKVKYSLGFTSRGCIRACGFCVVPQKEGGITEHSPLSEFVRHKKVVLMDNNFLASPRAAEKLMEIKALGIKVDFNQGLDIRLMTPEFARLLTAANPSILRFAWDNMADEPAVKKGLAMLRDAGYPINHRKISFYVLTNYNTSFAEDFYRVKYLHAHDIGTFVMLYNKERSTQLQRQFQSWANFAWAWCRYGFDKWLEYKKVSGATRAEYLQATAETP